VFVTTLLHTSILESREVRKLEEERLWQIHELKHGAAQRRG
jgi:hypothetical protein